VRIDPSGSVDFAADGPLAESQREHERVYGAIRKNEY
jgi:hypothetical protein